MASEDSYMSWTFDGPRGNLFMTSLDEEEPWYS